MTITVRPGRVDRPRSAPGRDARLVARGRRIKVLSWALTGVAVGMLGWIVMLGVSLPSSASTREWRLVWIGFDVGELSALLVTLWAIYRFRRIAIPAALVSGTLFLCDAWFDVVLSWGTRGWWLSVASAVFIEIPLAAVLWLSARSLVHAVINSPLPMRMNGQPARLRDLELIPTSKVTPRRAIAHDPMRSG